MGSDGLAEIATDQYSHVVRLLYAHYGEYHSDSQDIGDGVQAMHFGDKPDSIKKNTEEIRDELKQTIAGFRDRAKASKVIWRLLVEKDKSPEQEFHIPSTQCQRFWGTYCTILEKVNEEEVKADAELMAARYFERGNLDGLAVVLDSMSKYLDKKTLVEVVRTIAENNHNTYNPVVRFIKDVLENRKGLQNNIDTETLVEVIGILLKANNFSAVNESLRGMEFREGSCVDTKRSAIKKLFNDYMAELLDAGEYSTAHSMAYQLVKKHPEQAKIFLDCCASGRIQDGSMDGLYYLVSFASSPNWYETDEEPNYYIRGSVETAFKAVIEGLMKEAIGQEKPALEYVRERLRRAIEKESSEERRDYLKQRIENAFELFRRSSNGIIDPGTVENASIFKKSPQTPVPKAAKPAGVRY